MAQESSLERPVLLVVLVAVAGIAAGTAAAVTATVFPYALTLAIKHLRTKAKKDPKDPSSSSSGKSGILKGDSKTRSAKSKHADGSASAANDPKDVISLEVKRRKDCLVRSILKWTDIDVTFDTFPYYLKYARRPPGLFLLQKFWSSATVCTPSALSTVTQHSRPTMCTLSSWISLEAGLGHVLSSDFLLLQ